MRKLMIGILAIGSVAVASPALALCTNTGGAVGGAAAGAATGAVVGGPVGAAVGGVVGGTVGATLPPTSCTYVVETQVEPVTIEQEVIVGQPLPNTVVLHEIPDTDRYVFAYVNNKRVIVDPQTKVVVEVVAN